MFTQLWTGRRPRTKHRRTHHQRPLPPFLRRRHPPAPHTPLHLSTHHPGTKPPQFPAHRHQPQLDHTPKPPHALERQSFPPLPHQHPPINTLRMDNEHNQHDKNQRKPTSPLLSTCSRTGHRRCLPHPTTPLSAGRRIRRLHPIQWI